jgi:hypothetical protein
MPYINALPRSLNLQERVQVSTTRGDALWSLVPVKSMSKPQTGSAIAELIVSRSGDPSFLYDLTYQASLMDYGNGSPNPVSVGVTL